MSDRKKIRITRKGDVVLRVHCVQCGALAAVPVSERSDYTTGIVVYQCERCGGEWEEIRD